MILVNFSDGIRPRRKKKVILSCAINTPAKPLVYVKHFR